MILRTIQETPDSLLENGAFHYGFFKRPFRRVNLLQNHTEDATAACIVRRLRLKEWLGFGIDHPGLYGAVFMQNSGYAASGTVYFYDKLTWRFYEWLLVDLPGRVRLPESLWSGECRCGLHGGSLYFAHDLEHGRHLLRADIKATSRAPALRLELLLHQNMDEIDPLVVSLPIKPHGHTYTHKSPFAIDGTVRIGGQTYEFESARDLGNLDEQKTFYPYRSAWKWGCLATRSETGRLLALNFVNQMTPEDEPGEDAMWLDGRLSLLPRPTITPLPQPGRYRIEDAEGRLRLVFSELGAKREKRNYGLISMDYEQRFGTYDGEVTDAEGGVHRIAKAFGPLERMQARF